MRTIKFRLIKDNKIVSTQELKPNGIIDCPVDWDIACQFTGLLDKQGKEIYEGDIVRYTEDNWNGKHEHTQEVKYTIEHFTDGEYGYSMGVGFDIGWNEDEEPEIIGNIYANPELLESKQ